MLKVDGLNQYYGGSHILRNVGFEAKQGEVTVVLGRNGVGKTTLLKSLMGVVPVKTGSVVLAGTDITRATPYERVRLGIGYVPQGREIFSRLTVEDNLKMGLAVKPGGTPLPPMRPSTPVDALMLAPPPSPPATASTPAAAPASSRRTSALAPPPAAPKPAVPMPAAPSTTRKAFAGSAHHVSLKFAPNPPYAGHPFAPPPAPPRSSTVAQQPVAGGA